MANAQGADPSAQPAQGHDVSRKANGTRRVLIVDDHPIVLAGLTQVINRKNDLEVCGEASDARAAMAAIKEHQPHLVMVDLGLTDIGGLELIKQIKSAHESLPVLVLSMQDEHLYAERALRAGASGYVMKQAGSATVIKAIRTVLRGDIYVSEKMASRVLGRMMGNRGSAVENASPVEALSDRELEVFEWLGRGLGTRQIAEKLCLSVKTIESHREQIKKKLRLTSAAELSQHATRWVVEESG